MSKADDLFFKEFGAILIALTVFGFAMYFLASFIGGNAFDEIQNSPSAVHARIVPVAQVRLDGEVVPVAAAVPAPAAAPAAGAGKSGEEVYAAACAACHTAGVAGAPKTGDAAAWGTRFEQGLDALVASAVKGKGAMPAKGGIASLSDDEVRRAVVYLLSESGMDVPAEESAPATQAAAPEAPASEAPKTAEAQMAPATEEPKAEMAPAEEPKAAAAETAPVEEPKAEQVAAASAGRPGDEIYKMACAACHIAGVAGAPKTGDNAAWAKRAEAGVDALVSTVVKGKGAMPAKGGNASLSEDDIRNAVNYLLEQAGVSG